ncbi:UNVERIFIED_CONTAM: hypothetical protein FKN15_076060 [Acipenser sinensis]
MAAPGRNPTPATCPEEEEWEERPSPEASQGATAISSTKKGEQPGQVPQPPRDQKLVPRLWGVRALCLTDPSEKMSAQRRHYRSALR